jgi:hypothetical protein
MILKRSRCIVDMVSQILSDKTEDVGKQCGLSFLFIIQDNLY